MARSVAGTKGKEWVQSLFATWQNALITLALAYGALRLLPPAIDWVFLDAVWAAPDAEACRAVEGACWAFIREKLRFIFFGYYPYDQQWRPLCAMIALLALLGASASQRAWNRWLPLVWLMLIGLALSLLRGGWAGLSVVPTAKWGGVPLTLLLAILGSVLAFPLGVVLALCRTSTLPLIRWISIGYIELVRGVPLITVLFMASVMLPLFMPRGVQIDAVVRAQVGIILFAAAYFAEVIRGGLLSIPKGQFEAADALGLRYWAKMRLVVMPQVLKVSVPPLTNTFIGLIKDSSLVAIVGLVDLLGASRQALSDPQWLGFYREAYLFAALLYFIMCYSVARYARRLEYRLRRREQH